MKVLAWTPYVSSKTTELGGAHRSTWEPDVKVRPGAILPVSLSLIDIGQSNKHLQVGPHHLHS